MNRREKLNKLRGRNDYVDIIFYSYKMSKHAHINEHELKRLEHSISSIRDFNNEIIVYLFCDDPSFIPHDFILDYSVRVEPFEEGFDHNMLNAWSIHRWYNLKYFNKDHNLLYVDSDTIFYQDPKYLFDTYCVHDVYGREEFGFKYDPTTGGGRNIRDQLDLVDACIYDLGGKVEVYKYCLGVVLLNNSVHKKIRESLDELSQLMEQFRANEVLFPVPNQRIVDEYGVWVMLSRLGVSTGLFSVQDVTQGWLEEKHMEYFNPVVLHYTTKKEQEFVSFNKMRFANLERDSKKLAEHIDPYSSQQTTSHMPSEMIELVAEDSSIVVPASGENDYVFDE
jgi:hypothetical protein